MEISLEIKRFLLMVAAGLPTGIAVQFATKYQEGRAALGARCEMERLIMGSLTQQTSKLHKKPRQTQQQ